MRNGFPQETALKVVGSCILLAVALPLGYHALFDPDIGWHLAGGLWMLEHSQVLQTDPFGAAATPWISYSWLPELLFAAVYRVSGFHGLQLLQMLLSAFSLFAIFVMNRRYLSAEEEQKKFFASLLSTLLCLPFFAPVFHLRPQLLSVLFAALLLTRIIEQRETVLGYLLPTVLWANTHVFWIFAPFFLCVRFVFERRAVHARLFLLLLLAGLCSPYGLENLRAIFTYALTHSEAYRLIDEFQPLRPSLGFIFYYSIASLFLIPVYLLRHGIRGGRQKLLFLTLLCIFAAASFLQRKYLPFYGLLLSPLFSEILSGMLRFRDTREASSAGKLLVFLPPLFLAASLLLIRAASPLRESEEEYLDLLASEPFAGRIFSSFDEGGWLALGIRLSGKEGSAFSLIDGRTLVMGEKRLREYSEVVISKQPVCGLLDRWNANWVILKHSSTLLKRILEEEKSCGGGWKVVTTGENWTVLRESLPERSAVP